MFNLNQFCPPDESFAHPWSSDGLTPCFFYTMESAITFSLLFLFGLTQVIIYGFIHKRPRLSTAHPISNLALYVLQLMSLWLLVLLPIIRLGFQDISLYERKTYGYMLFTALLSSSQWLLSIYMIYVERRWVVPGLLYPRRHSFALLLFWTSASFIAALSFLSFNSPLWFWQLKTSSDRVELAIWIISFILKLNVFITGLRAPALPDKEQWHKRLNENENTPLLNKSNTERINKSSTWAGVWRKTKLLAPSLWPKASILLQFKVVLSIILLIVGRVVNLYTPIFYKDIVDSLTRTFNKTIISPVADPITGLELRWDFIIVYVILRSLQGFMSGSGIIGLIRSQLWIPIQQYTTREMSVKLFNRLHSLSLGWHLSRKTGEVLRIMDRGTSSLDSILNYLLFNITPTLADIVIGVIYFASAFNLWFGLIVFVTMILYLALTIIITEWRTKYRRLMNSRDNLKNAAAVDSLLNFETVKYYAAEEFEVNRYRNAIASYQEAEWQSVTTMNGLNFIQNVVINLGFLVGSLLCAYFVVIGQDGFTVGDFVLFCTYIMQLYSPLNWFGTYYRQIQTNFVDMENMFELLEQKVEITDIPNAPPLDIKQGKVEFRNVNFHYNPEKKILHNISFTIEPGKTVALVGNSGGGKSTIVRILNRFYDIQSGEILIDGQNIAHVQQTSLRKAIGVVPQDTVLFNANIRYNIRYGRIDATDEEVEAAAQAADIHFRILGFPNGYDTVVGERGLKLSGGEKQRVAIARTLLKAPRIALLDEATSALDTATERNIQRSLDKVCENRTTLIVAHRLSTIVHADLILVITEGNIVERGTHQELLSQNGIYSHMWNRQLRAENKKMKSSQKTSTESE